MLAARFGVTVSGQMRVGPNTMATLWTCIRFSLLWSTTLENIKKETHSAIQKQQHIDVNVFPWNRQQKWYSSVNFPENFTWKFKHCFNVIFTCIFLARNTMWNLCEMFMSSSKCGKFASIGHIVRLRRKRTNDYLISSYSANLQFLAI